MMEPGLQKYSFILRNLHFIGGVAFVAALVLGLVMEDMEGGPAKFQLMFFHKSMGLLVLGISAVRLLEWLRSTQPGPLENYSKLERNLSKAVKVGLYGVMIALPVSGLMVTWLAGYPAAFFGLFEIASPMAKNPGLHEVLEEVHEAFVPITFLLLGLHVAGAIKHHVIDKDATLARMNPLGAKSKQA